jgi:hypothetical protein
MPYTECQKRATYKWNAKNIEYVRISNLKAVTKYKTINKDAINLRARNKYQFEKEWKIFRNILL